MQGDNLYIGIAETKENIGEGFTSTGNIITGKSQASGTGTVQTEYWKELTKIISGKENSSFA